MEIKPAYVTFEQAKLLKEKGFNVPCSFHYTGRWIENTVHGLNEPNGFYEGGYTAPEQWQVCEWLRIKHGIWILIIPTVTSNWTYKTIRVIGEVDNDVISGLKSVSDLPPYKDVCGYDFSTPQEAYSAAFDCILKELI